MHCKFLLFSFLSPGRTVNGAGDDNPSNRQAIYLRSMLCVLCMSSTISDYRINREKKKNEKKQPAPTGIGNNRNNSKE